MTLPKVTIGIPTYNRAARLEKAVRSALAQDYANIEVLISDNASSDGTQALCESLAALDPRIRYLWQQRNCGPTANFERTLTEAKGEMFMWLADDDYLEPSYVERCVTALCADSSLVLATTTALFDAGPVGAAVSECHRPYQQGRPERRSLAYLSEVSRNSAIFGVMRKDFAAGTPFPRRLAGDWIFVCLLLLRGRSVSVPEAVIHRSHGGAGSNMEGLLRVLELPAWQRHVPELVIAWNNASALCREMYRLGRPFLTCAGSAWCAFWILMIRRSRVRRWTPRWFRREWMASFLQPEK